MTTDKPWVKLYKGYPAEIAVPDATMYEALAAQAGRTPSATAVVYLGKKLTFAQLMAEIDRCAAAFAAGGVGARDTVVLSLPNVPNVIVCFYALNKIGARVAMTHPLSSSDELKHYITITQARWVVTVDMFYQVFHDLAAETGLERIVIAHIPDYLPPVMKVGFKLTRGRAIAPVPATDPLVIGWREFMATGASVQRPYTRPIAPDDGAVVLFSGGTTDMPKGIELSSVNFNALFVGTRAISGLEAGDSVLAILPVFHGFGLGLCVHTTLCGGAYSILVPDFSADNYLKSVIKYRPSYIAGVPTLFQALLRHPLFKKARFETLKGAYSGGDLLSADLKHRFDEAIQAQGATVELMEGYGLTECVTACATSPLGLYRENSMGIPMPNMRVKIADSATGNEVPYGTEGEFCVAGPTLMKGYVKDPEATLSTLREHADGRVWLHTGDIGTMDADGYLYFLGRIKRIVKVSGVSVYPMQIEQVLESHPLVSRACVIGLPDEYQVSSLKAFVVLADGTTGSDAVAQELRAYCKEHLIKWAVPRQVEFRATLPMTKVGKIAFTDLERDELAKLKAA